MHSRNVCSWCVPLIHCWTYFGLNMIKLVLGLYICINETSVWLIHSVFLCAFCQVLVSRLFWLYKKNWGVCEAEAWQETFTQDGLNKETLLRTYLYNIGKVKGDGATQRPATTRAITTPRAAGARATPLSLEPRELGPWRRGPGESWGWGHCHCQREGTKVGREQEERTKVSLLPAFVLSPELCQGAWGRSVACVGSLGAGAGQGRVWILVSCLTRFKHTRPGLLLQRLPHTDFFVYYDFAYFNSFLLAERHLWAFFLHERESHSGHVS